MEEKISFWKILFFMSSVLARNYLFKVSNWSTRIKCENCSRLKMKTLEWCQFVLILDFEQANVYWVHIEKPITFEDKIGSSCFMLQHFKCEQNLLTNSIWTYTNLYTTLRRNQWEIFATEFTVDVDSD